MEIDMKKSNNKKAKHSYSINAIQCDVVNCQYHDKNRKCTAEKINVGPQYAVSSQDTVCATFKPGKHS